MKKVLAMLLILVLLSSIVPVSSASESGTCGKNLTWQFDEENKTLTISGTGDMYDYIANAPWFTQRLTSKIEKIRIEEGVTGIGSWAFEDCRMLTEVSFPESLKKIGASAFDGCAALQSVYIPASTTRVVERAFAGCSGLQEILVDPENTKYCNDEFGVLYTKDLQQLVQYPAARQGAYEVGDQVVLICDFAFYECRGLTEITLPKTLVAIGVYGFYDCRSLRTVDIPENVKTVATAAFSDCLELRHVTVRTEKTQFQDAAFYECTNLKHLLYKGTSAQWYASFPTPEDGHLDAVMHFGASGDELTKQPDGSLYCSICQRDICSEASFSDVEEADYFYDPVLWAVENNITNGMSETEFAPDAFCTRGQVVTFLWRAAKQPEVSSKNNPFTDVEQGQYYYDAVLWAVEAGITNGYSATQFAPDKICTRAQVATFLWRWQGQPLPKNPTNPFTDVAPSAYYYDAVLWAVEKGITNGVSATAFAPDADCTRGQIVTFLYRNDLNKGVDYSLYVPVLEETIAVRSGEKGEGFLFDFDGNGVKELVMTYYTNTDVPMCAVSLYTIDRNRAVALLDRVPLFYDAGAPTGWAGAVKYYDNTYLAITEDNGGTGGPEAVRDGSWRVYSIRGAEAAQVFSAEYAIGPDESSATINGEPKSYEDYLAWTGEFHLIRTMDGSSPSLMDPLAFTFEDLITVVQQPTMKVALITDHGAMQDIGMSELWSGVDGYCYKNSIEHCYYWMATPYALTEYVDLAVKDGNNIIALMGYTAQSDEMKELQEKYPEVKFLTFDQKKGESEDVDLAENRVCISYKVEQAGFMAGYASVKLGYRKLGLLMSPETESKEYGYGFLMGADCAAVEDGIAGEVEVNCTYAEQYYPSQQIYDEAAAWYQGGTQVIFTGDAYIVEAVALAAAEYGGKVIGTMVDQAGELNFVTADELFINSDFVQPEGGSPVTMSSAMIGLDYSAQYMLNQIQRGNWDSFGGKLIDFGMEDGRQMLQLALSTQFNESFTWDSYEHLQVGLWLGSYTVEVGETLPVLSITLHELP